MRILIIILCVLFFGCSQDKYGTTTENSGIYQRDGSPILEHGLTVQSILLKGARVKLIDARGCPAKDSEKMVIIMIPNEADDFVKGYQACMPERKIAWDK